MGKKYEKGINVIIKGGSKVTDNATKERLEVHSCTTSEDREFPVVEDNDEAILVNVKDDELKERTVIVKKEDLE